MKNRMTDVRDHLVLALENLADDDCTSETIERARATALVADKFIASVKVEIDARKMLDKPTLPPVLIAADQKPIPLGVNQK